jgi:hypothetical protein
MDSSLAKAMAAKIAFNYAKRRLVTISSEKLRAETQKDWSHCIKMCRVPPWLKVAHDEVEKSALEELLKT